MKLNQRLKMHQLYQTPGFVGWKESINWEENPENYVINLSEKFQGKLMIQTRQDHYLVIRNMQINLTE